MDAKTLHVLEYDKILERLRAFCDFSASMDLARALQPTANFDEAQRLLKETTEARNLFSVSDIGIDGMEARQLRTALHGNVQSALSHEHEQTNCFERHRFTTGVRTGDNNGARALFWVNVNGHDCV